MIQYYLHTGLHKTGTKFFQHKVFPNLNKNEINYNPPKLSQLICDLLKANEEDVDFVLNAIHEEKHKLEKEASANKVLISREIMSGDLFSFYSGFKDNYTRLNQAFPEAKIIIALRYQTDWIVSCYRETLHEHHYQSLSQFLLFEQGEDKFVKANYKELNYSGILSIIKKLFGAKNVNVFFYEDFSRDKLATLKQILKILGISSLPLIKDSETIPNRGYSSLAIYLSIKRYHFLKTLNIDGYLVHRPIRFFGKDSIPAGFEDLSVLPKNIYWHKGFLRDNEEVRTKGYPNMLSSVEKIKLNTSWRNFIKKGFDRLFYKNWDMLNARRSLLDKFFKDNNVQLLNEHADLISNLPKQYKK